MQGGFSSGAPARGSWGKVPVGMRAAGPGEPLGAKDGKLELRLEGLGQDSAAPPAVTPSVRGTMQWSFSDCVVAPQWPCGGHLVATERSLSGLVMIIYYLQKGHSVAT